jgi:hypothetical protein
MLMILMLYTTFYHEEARQMSCTRAKTTRCDPVFPDYRGKSGVDVLEAGTVQGAEELEVQVMETRLKVLRQEHPDTLAIMSNSASTYRDQGQWKEAQELEVQVMEASLRALGHENPNNADLYGQSGGNVLESRTVERGRGVGSASYGDKKEGARTRASLHVHLAGKILNHWANIMLGG